MNTFFVWIEVRLILPKVTCVSSRVHTYLLTLPVALHSFSASSSLTVFFSSLFTFYSSPCQCILSYFISFGHSFLFIFFIHFSSVLITLFLTYTSSFLSFLSTVSFFGHALFHSHLKNAKSRGSKHKSRRKSKKQKRPSSVCNSLT